MPQRRKSKIFPVNLYIYLQEENANFAKTRGKELFGSFSAYINALIAKDRKVKPVLGGWKARGEAKRIREALSKKKKQRYVSNKRKRQEKRDKVKKNARKIA